MRGKNIGRIYSSGRANDIEEDLKQSRESLSPPLLYRVVVVDIIFDPSLLTDDKKDEYKTILSTDILLNSVPRNSIIGRKVRRAGEILSSAKIFYPFFPPHLCFPVKAGEHVWVIYEHPDEEDMGYWLCRIPEKRTIDDVNYTHADRKWLYPDEQSLVEQDTGDTQIDKTIVGFPNGDGSPETFSLSHPDGNIKNVGKEYDDLVEVSLSKKIETHEPVPRLTKRPGDFAIQGSNNTAIILGQDRTGGVGDETGLPIADSQEGSGAIDVVVGRGQSDPTKPVVITNSRQEEETNKNTKFTLNQEELKTEGDIDFIHDKSRLYLSMKTHADKNFQIELEGLDDNSNPETAAAVLKSDQVRIVARQDIKILVASEDGDLTKACSLTLKVDGNIVLIPGSLSVFKIGSDGADKAVVCTNVPATVVNGEVVGISIKTTMGGVIANNSPGFGKFAKKILVD